MNIVILSGFVKESLKIFTTTTGQDMVNFTIKVPSIFKNEEGKYNTQYFNVKAFGTLARHMFESIKENSLVQVRGCLTYSTYKTKDGTSKVNYSVIAEEYIIAVSNYGGGKSQKVVGNQVDSKTKHKTSYKPKPAIDTQITAQVEDIPERFEDIEEGGVVENEDLPF